jgi:AcrR family transcriptional regulator
MYKLCKTEQSARRQRQLEQGLLEMMRHSRYEDISVSNLCDHFGVPRKSFYRYFSSKDGCLYALLDHTMMDFFDEAVGSSGIIPGTQIGDLDRFFLFWQQRRTLLEVLQRNALAGVLVERAMALALKERLMPGYLQDASQEVQQMALSFAVCGLISMVIQWHGQGFKIPAQEMTKIAVSILTKPLIQ